MKEKDYKNLDDKNNTKKIKKLIIVFCILLVLTFLIILGIKVININSNIITQNLYNISNNQDNKDNADNVDNVDKEENNSNTPTDLKLDSTDIFSKYYDKAETLMKSMSLDEKVAQMFLVRYTDSSSALTEIKNEHPGGYILFKKDFENHTKDSILAELNRNQEASKIRLFFAVDEEGGTVVRVSAFKNFRASKFLSPQALGSIENIVADSKEKNSLLKSIGINVNLAPVADIPTNKDSFIYDRSYGKDAKATSEYVASLIKTMNSDNMISSIKHFPGYGDNVDTHTGIAIDTRDYSTFQNSDFLPFIAGIKEKAPTILVNHNIINCMDSKYPASLSENVHKILRNDLEFSGLIITDDLAMDAVKQYALNNEAATQAVIAGNDIIITSDFVNQKQEVLNAIKSNKISEDTINKAVRRILACKYMYGIIK